MSHNHHTPMMFRALFSPLIAVTLALSSVILIPGWAGRARAAGAPLYVKPGGSTTGTCDSWDNACDLSFALSDVAVSGDEIWVAEGIYKPSNTGDRLVSFGLKSGVALYGGFAGTESSRDERDWETHVVTLTGDLNDNGLDGNDSYHVVTSDNNVIETAVLDGFTISGGNADDEASAEEDRGGGIYIMETNLAVRNTVFISNSAVTAGGGIYNDRSGLELENVTFRANTAVEGGGMYNYQSNPLVKDSTFMENSTTIDLVTGGAGGGMYNTNSSPELWNTIFNNNTADGGGGMANWNYSSPVLYNTRFIDNSAGDGTGGGMYNLWHSNPKLYNAIFIGNMANSGGGLYNDTNSNSTLVNVTFTGNVAVTDGGIVMGQGSDATLANSILWNNDPVEIVVNTGSTLAIKYSLMSEACQSGVSCGGGMVIGADPQFTDVAADDLRLLTTSPAIDAGDNSAVPPEVTTDLIGMPRFLDMAGVVDTGNGTAPVVDMGAIETVGADLAMAKSVMPSSAAPGQVVTFTLVYSNVGWLPAAGVVITDLIPTEINPATLTVLSSGVSITPVSGVSYAWQAQDMDVGARGVITITGNVRMNLSTLPQTITNTAVIATTSDDSNNKNNSASAQVILARTSTAVTLVSAPNPSILSQAAGFTVTVTSGIPGGITPTGSVTLTIDTTAIVLPLNPNGKASYVTSALAVGTHSVTATYGGDTTFGPSDATLPGGHVVRDVPVTALTAANSSPTKVHHVTTFTATASGTNIVYQWNFGDGTAPQVGNLVNHTYATYGTYTAVLTATNAGSVSTMQMSVRIEPYRTFVPMLRR